MTRPLPTNVTSVQPRPVGFVEPRNDRARRAMKALADARWVDAEENIAAIDGTFAEDRMWKPLLLGRLAVARGRLPAAEMILTDAAAEGRASAAECEDQSEASLWRLAAVAYDDLGRVCRRQDRPEEARLAHRSAYDLRCRYGSAEEEWESCLALGVDAELVRDFEQAQHWYRLAIDVAAQASEDSEKKRAVGWSQLAASLINGGRHAEAVDAARTARDWWYRHDPASVEIARADLKLGYALLKHGESLHESDRAEAANALDEAAEWLAEARESLEAFGCLDDDHRWSLEQEDFVRRLRAGLDV